MGRIDKNKGVIIIYVNKSQYLIGNPKLLDLDYGTKIVLDLGNLIKKGLLKNKPKKEVFSVFAYLYLMPK